MSSEAVCETIWRKACMLRACNCCEICGLTAPLHVHHIVYRRHHPILVWDYDNGVVLCGGPKFDKAGDRCHDKAHRHRAWLIERLPARVSPERMAAISKLLQAALKVVREKPDWKAIAADLKYCLKQAQNIYDYRVDCDLLPGSENWRPS